MTTVSTPKPAARPGVIFARTPGWRLLPAALAAVVVLVPMVYLLVRAIQIPSDRLRAVLFESRALDYLLNTLGLGISVSAATLAGGVAIAVGINRGRFPRQRIWLVLSALPLAIPSYLAAYGWLVIWPTLSGYWPAFVLLTAVTMPYVILPTVAALRSTGGDQERVARTLGKTPLAAFWVTTWPQIRPAALAGTLLVFLYTVSDFGLPAMLRFHTLTWGVNAAYSSSFDRNQAAVLALLLLLLGLIGVLGERRVRGQRELAAGRTRPIGPAPSPVVRRTFMALALAPFIVGVIVPMFGLVTRLLQVETAQAIDVPRLLEATAWTVTVSLAAAIAATLVALPIAAVAARFRTQIVRVVESMGYLSHALPGIVVGLSLVFLTIRSLPALYQTVIVLVFGYTVLFTSKAIGASRASIEGVSPTLLMVARTLGETRFGAWRRVTLPLALPGIGIGALLVMISTMKELPATLILRPTGVNTLATELWTKTLAVEYGQAAPYAALLVLIAAIPAMFLSGARSEKGQTT